jgi:hypothetical protein
MAEPESGATARRSSQARGGRRLACPQCAAELDPADHGNLVFDGRVWCDRCHAYDRELIRPRPIEEIEAWSRLICRAFVSPAIRIEHYQDPARYRLAASVLMAEADHQQKSICFYPPGCRLATLCHELAHLYTGQNHTGEWAEMFADLVAWVKVRLDNGHGPPGYQARMSIYAGVPKRVY